jgi:hypothetical protein
MVSGSGSSITFGNTFGISGSIVAGGAISLNASGSAAGSAAVFSGTIDVTTGTVGGRWNYSGKNSGGTFAGQKQ